LDTVHTRGYLVNGTKIQFDIDLSLIKMNVYTMSLAVTIVTLTPFT